MTLASTTMNPSMTAVALPTRPTKPAADSFWKRIRAAAQASGSTVGRSRRTMRAAVWPRFPAACSPLDTSSSAPARITAAITPPTAIHTCTGSISSAAAASANPTIGAVNLAR